jgi:hypothetical protein
MGIMKAAYRHERLTRLPMERRTDMNSTIKTLAAIEGVKLAGYLAIAAVAYTAFGLW